MAASDALADLLDNHDQVAARYHDCASGAAALVASMDEWRATAWRWYCAAVARAGLRADGCPGAR